jgi:hypothetical protein
MTHSPFVANAILWAAAILAAAISGAPLFLTLFLLPSLASAALLATRPKERLERCPARHE